MRLLSIFVALFASIITAQGGTARIYYDNCKSNWHSVKIYYWGGSNGLDWDASKHGLAMARIGNSNLWYADIPDDITGLLFNNHVSGVAESDQRQTYDINPYDEGLGVLKLHNWRYMGHYENEHNKLLVDSYQYDPMDASKDIYLCGNLNNGQEGVISDQVTWGYKLTNNGDGTHSARGVELVKVSDDNPWAYFNFNYKLGSSWDEVNSDDRLGSTKKDKYIEAPATDDLVLYGNYNGINWTQNGWCIAPGVYDIDLNLSDMTISVDKTVMFATIFYDNSRTQWDTPAVIVGEKSPVAMTRVKGSNIWTAIVPEYSDIRFAELNGNGSMYQLSGVANSAMVRNNRVFYYRAVGDNAWEVTDFDYNANPETLYIRGDLGANADAVTLGETNFIRLNKVGNKFTADNVDFAEYVHEGNGTGRGYFSLVSDIEQGYDEANDIYGWINAHDCYGATAPNAMAIPNKSLGVNHHIAYISAGLTNSWSVAPGKYNVEFDLDTYTLTLTPIAPATLYITGTFGDGWHADTSNTFTYNPANNTYSYSADFNWSERHFVLTTTTGVDGGDWGGLHAGGLGVSGNNLAEATETILVDDTDNDIYLPFNGYWTITVKYDAETGKFTHITATTVNMPLKKADFEDGKAHYFLVGSRQGDWHLQPEWEFTVDDNGTLAIDKGRFMYAGFIGVAKVDNFEDYIHQRFELFSNAGRRIYKDKGAAWADATLGDNSLVSLGKHQGYVDYSEILFDNSNAMTFFADQHPDDFPSLGIEWTDCSRESRGVYVGDIRLTLEDGNPTAIMFNNILEDNPLEFIFQIVGSHIANDNLRSLPYKRPLNDTQSIEGTSWHDGYLQYDADGNIYHDANGEYLYQTAYTRSWFASHPSIFYRADDKLSFTSQNITFVNAKSLVDSDSDPDPYKNFYTSRVTNPQIGANEPFTWSDGKYTYEFRELMSDSRNESEYRMPGDGRQWECFVVKDVWVKGAFKIWSGFGGNSVYYEFDNPRHISEVRESQRWNRENGGPGNKDVNQYISGHDINSVSDVYVYPTYKDVENANFDMGDTETFFNRMILWYNAEDGINNAVLQLVSETAGPQIRAYHVEGDNKAIEYRWSINQTGVVAGSQNDKEIKEFSVYRYRVADGETLEGAPQISNNPLPSKKMVSDFTESNLETFIDNGYAQGERMDGENLKPGFLAPGTYYFVISVTYTDGVTKTAKSNQITIYDPENQLYPDPLAVQMLLLTEDEPFTDANGVEYTDVIAYLDPVHAEQIKAKGTPTYLTYRSNTELVYYLLNPSNEDPTVDDYAIEIHDVDDVKARYIIRQHPELYFWTSDFYIRALSAETYNAKMNEYRNKGMILQGSNPVPTLNVTEGDGSPIKAVKSTVIKGGDAFNGEANAFTPSGASYYGTIVHRQGDLSSSKIAVDMSYDVDEQPTRHSQRSVDILPVVPMPYSLTHRYENIRREAVDDAPATVTVEVRSAIQEGNPEMELLFNTTDAITRHFDCVYTLVRPNVVLDILQKYDIEYDVRVFTTDTGKDADEQTSVILDNVLRDVEIPESTARKAYNISVLDVNPHGDDGVASTRTPEIYPTFEVVSTDYVNNTDANRSLRATYSYTDLIDAAPNTVKRGEAPTIGLLKLGLADNRWYTHGNEGADHENEGSYAWMLYGYDGFTGPSKGTDIDVHDANTMSLMNPSLYMIETKGANNKYSHSDYLIKFSELDEAGQVSTHYSSQVFGNEGETLNGYWIANGMDDMSHPEIYLVPVYVFLREPEMKVNMVNLAPVNAPQQAPKRIGPAPDPETDSDALFEGETIVPTKTYVGVTGTPTTNLSTPEHLGEIVVTSVDAAMSDILCGDACYFNLQGIRVENPCAGQVYIVRRGEVTSKVLVK